MEQHNPQIGNSIEDARKLKEKSVKLDEETIKKIKEKDIKKQKAVDEGKIVLK